MFTNESFIPFNFNMPIYNWFYPMSYSEISVDLDSIKTVFERSSDRVSNRSLYFHIPFCQDICSFCPFTREVLKDEAFLDRYVDALIKEIGLKAKYRYISEKPITSIFFGGGTPSILLPKHILRIGNAIKDNFDLSSLKEFSFEMNAKTVLPERVAAMREVGVTHGRMGVQTFNPEYRDMFKLSATLENIYYGAELLNKTFDYVCIDMLYGMHGQTAEDIIKDLRQARQLGTSHMDVYPINNGVIQKRLKEEYDKRNFKATSALNKYLFNVLIYDYLHSNEFVPHNGHGYYRSQSVANINGFVDNGYTFQYHESVYGYAGHEIVAFGTVGYSVFNEFLVSNQADIRKYISTIESGNLPIAGIATYPRELTEIKGLVLHLPYHGYVEKNKMDYRFVDDDLNRKIAELISLGMIGDNENTLNLTRIGWQNYVNLLFYLSPQREQNALLGYIKRANLYSEFAYSLDFGIK